MCQRRKKKTRNSLCVCVVFAKTTEITDFCGNQKGKSLITKGLVVCTSREFNL